jgi:D-alanine--poly(phosphoribitol) ligase subunit 1
VLDAGGGRVPDGEIGELCLLGPNVGKGYYNDAERTRAQFVQDPFQSCFPQVMYKTGDRVHRGADGKYYIHGRVDNQIKHMGYRIEPEEIEAGLHSLEYVAEAVVLQSTAGGFSRIVAVVSTREHVDSGRLRADLKQILPDYMLPSVFHLEQTLPKNANGKIDRLGLAAKYAAAPTESEPAHE